MQRRHRSQKLLAGAFAVLLVAAMATLLVMRDRSSGIDRSLWAGVNDDPSSSGRLPVDMAQPVEGRSPRASALICEQGIVANGVRSVEDVERARTVDPVVGRHYSDIDVPRLKAVEIAAPREAYMSYRIGDNVYWTSAKVAFAEGEAILTDGASTIYARCGSLLSDAASTPTSALEARLLAGGLSAETIAATENAAASTNLARLTPPTAGPNRAVGASGFGSAGNAAGFTGGPAGQGSQTTGAAGAANGYQRIPGRLALGSGGDVADGALAAAGGGVGGVPTAPGSGRAPTEGSSGTAGDDNGGGNGNGGGDDNGGGNDNGGDRAGAPIGGAGPGGNGPAAPAGVAPQTPQVAKGSPTSELPQTFAGPQNPGGTSPDEAPLDAEGTKMIDPISTPIIDQAKGAGAPEPGTEPGGSINPNPNDPGNPGTARQPAADAVEEPELNVTVPEPAALLLFGSGLTIAAWRFRRGSTRRD